MDMLGRKPHFNVDFLSTDVEGGYILRELIGGWKFIAISVGVAIVLSFILLAILPKSYTATIVVQPAMRQPSDLSDTLASQGLRLGGFRSSSSVTPFQRFINTLDSYDVAKRLQDKDKMLQRLYPNRWDAETKSWKPARGVGHWLSSIMKKMISFPAHDQPTVQDLEKYIHNNIRIVESEDTSIHELSFRHKSPEFARWFLQELVIATDDEIKNDTRASTFSYASYLLNEMDKITSTDLRTSLIELIIEQERKKMMIASNLPYSITIIDGPYVYDIPTSPNPSLAVF